MKNSDKRDRGGKENYHKKREDKFSTKWNS